MGLRNNLAKKVKTTLDKLDKGEAYCNSIAENIIKNDQASINYINNLERITGEEKKRVSGHYIEKKELLKRLNSP